LTWRNDIAERLELLHREDRYLARYRTGNRSKVTVAQREEMGFAGIYHIRLSIGDWQAAGLPIVTEEGMLVSPDFHSVSMF